MKKREPYIVIATGAKGGGKTYTTCHEIEEYIKPDPSKGKVGRKVLIFDINKEYTVESLLDNKVTFVAKVLDIKDLKKWTAQKNPEVRRIIPVDENGRDLTLDGMIEMLKRILYYYKGGLLVLEDINKYLIGTNTAEIIGTLATNRHRDLDIYIHLQSLSPVTTRMWQNCQFIRFHKQKDSVERYKDRIPNDELYFVAEKLVRQKWIKDKRFYCYVNNEDDKISGKFSIVDFHKACLAYLQDHPSLISKTQSRYGKGEEAKKEATLYLMNDLMKYFGNKITALKQE